MSDFCECGFHCIQCEGCGKPECVCSCNIYEEDEENSEIEW